MATAAERKAARAKAKREAAEAVKTGKNASATQDEAAPPVPPPEERAPSATKSRNTVTVACKVPNGLILQNSVLEDDFEPVFGGGSRPIKAARPIGDPIHITGSARAIMSDPDAKRVVGGYGLTFNVPKEAFEKWMKDNAALDMVKNGLIFAHDSPDRATDQARDMRSTRSGLEALNVEGRKANGDYADPRMPKNIKKFKPDDDSTDIRGVA